MIFVFIWLQTHTNKSQGMREVKYSSRNLLGYRSRRNNFSVSLHMYMELFAHLISRYNNNKLIV